MLITTKVSCRVVGEGRTHVQVHAHKYGHVHICACDCGGEKSPSGVTPESTHLLFATVFLIDLVLPNSRVSPSLSLHPQNWN